MSLTGDNCDSVESREITKTELYSMIKCGSKRLSYKENTGTSDVWTKFKVIYLDDKPLAFVKCNTCISIFSWNSKLGTRSLVRHSCFVPEISFASQAQPGQLQISKLFPVKPPKEHVAALNDAILVGLAH